MPAANVKPELPQDLHLPISLLARYLFFLTRRPISTSNPHYLQDRLEGLKSLWPVLTEAGLPGLNAALEPLRAMTPGNFRRLAQPLQLGLLPLSSATEEMPPDFVVTETPPRPDFLAGSRRALLVLGPAIGIGDEIIFFPLPMWLKAASPDAEISVLSAYRGLWDRVDGVDQVIHYGDCATLSRALRGQPPFGKFDLTVLADFERPDLYPSLCDEPNVERYAEISLGAQTLVVVDNRQRWLHRTRRPLPYFANYYSALDHLMRWWGLTVRGTDRVSAIQERPIKPSDDELRIYVNPFTSKYDPAGPYWSHLLAALFPEPPVRPLRIVLESGPSATTQHFASTLLRSVAARTPPGVEVEIAWPDDGRQHTLAAVFAQLERAHLVLCSDSFAAHAAPLFGCATLVLAPAGLENWRVPYGATYYFDSEAPIDHVAGGMRQILEWFSTTAPLPPSGSPVTEIERDLDALTRGLERLFEDPEVLYVFDQLCAHARDFDRAYARAVERLSHWPDQFGPFLDVMSGPTPSARLDGAVASMPDAAKAALILHLQDHWQRWQQTNLRKYLHMVLHGVPGASRKPELVSSPHDAPAD